ncbi:MAG: polymorphic toxin-type HINT domain-containing protein [Chloroflexota bacterium]
MPTAAKRQSFKTAAEIHPSDEVLAYDERTGRDGCFTVTAVHTHQDEALVRLIVDGEAIETTANHPFLTQDGDWRPAARLRVGDGLRQSAGRIGRVATVEPRLGSQVMYNLTVAEAHTYFVGAGGWLVHNGCPSGEPDRNQDQITSANSPVWRSLKPWQGKIRTNGESGSRKRFYRWDYLHNDIEVFDRNGKHLGTIDPYAGRFTKPAVPGRKL